MEGQNILLNNVKIKMYYDLTKTFSENKKTIIEQSVGRVGELFCTTDQKSGGKKISYFMGSDRTKVNTCYYDEKLDKECKQVKNEDINNKPWDYVWDPRVLSTEVDASGSRFFLRKGTWRPLSFDTVNFRRDKNGNYVPAGFSVDEYPEYLKKLKDVEKECAEDKNRTEKERLGKPSAESTGIKIYNQNYFTDKVCQDKKNALKYEFYKKDFPYGINREDYVLFAKEQTKLTTQQKEELKNTLESLSSKYQTIETNPGSDQILNFNNQFVTKISNEVLAGIYGKYNTMKEYLDVVFDRDPTYQDYLNEINKSDLQKWWEKWGVVVELVGWVVLDALTEGLIAYLSSARQALLAAKIVEKIIPSLKKLSDAEKISKIVKWGTNVGLPIAIGGLITAKQGEITTDSLIYFIFACLPTFHKIMGFNKTTPSKDVVEKLIGRMKQYRLFVGNQSPSPKVLKEFLKTCNQEEKELIRWVFTTGQSNSKKIIKDVVKEISEKHYSKILNLQKTALKQGLGVIKPSKLSKFGKFMFQFSSDLVAINVIEKLANGIGLTNELTEEQRKKIVETFKEWAKQKKDRPDLIVNLSRNIGLQSFPKFKGEKLKNIQSEALAADFKDYLSKEEEKYNEKIKQLKTESVENQEKEGVNLINIIKEKGIKITDLMVEVPK